MWADILRLIATIPLSDQTVSAEEETSLAEFVL